MSFIGRSLRSRGDARPIERRPLATIDRQPRRPFGARRRPILRFAFSNNERPKDLAVALRRPVGCGATETYL